MEGLLHRAAGVSALWLAFLASLASLGCAEGETQVALTDARRLPYAAMIARGFEATPLLAAFPAGYDCPTIASAFGARTRGDGSLRNTRFYYGYHSGADIYQPRGTPILAVAAGEVVAKFEGSGIGGLTVVLRHSPEDTGLSVWTFSEYKHLDEMPPTPIGTRQAMGDMIGLTGNTGTGQRAAHHLHLAILWNLDGAFRIHDGSPHFEPVDGYFADPLAFYRGTIRTEEVKRLAGGARNVLIPVLAYNDRPAQEGAKRIWPYACVRR